MITKQILTKLTCFLLLVLTSNAAFSEEDEKDFGMQKGDFSISIGGGKNVFFDDEFDLVAPYLVPGALNFALTNKLEIGLEYAPTFFADRNNVNFGATSAAKNHQFGGIQAFGGDLKYAVYNDYGVMAYFSGGGKYASLDKNQYNEGELQELDGTGRIISIGAGVRYQLGDEDGDVFPWFFDLGIFYTRSHYAISSYKTDGNLQPTTDSHYQDLNFGGLDVVLRFGYRFRKK